MKTKYSACIYFKLLKSYRNKYSYRMGLWHATPFLNKRSPNW
jgi:hypothetical protein